MYGDDAPAAGLVTGIGTISGHAVRDRRQRRHGQGRHLLSRHGQEASARPGGRGAERASVRLLGRLGRGVLAAPGRGLPRPRPLRAHLLQPGAHVGAGDPADRRGDGLVHGRRRVRPRDGRRVDHRQGPGHDLPGRAAAGAGGDRRDRHRRRARRRGRAHAHQRRGRSLRGRRRARARDRAPNRGPPRPRAVRRVAGARAAAARARSARALRHHPVRRAAVVRRARGDRAHRRRLRLRGVQGALRQHAGVRVRARRRPPGRHPREQRHPVQRVGAQGRALHRAVLPARHPAGVLAEHHRAS